jgi:hypothetical protein
MIQRGRLRSLEGRRVSIALADGSCIDDGELVSAGRPSTQTVWLCLDGTDVFIATAEVADISPARDSVEGSRQAAA